MKIFLILTACCFLIAIMAGISNTDIGTMIALAFIFLLPFWGVAWLVIFTILLLNIFLKRKRAREAETIDETV